MFYANGDPAAFQNLTATSSTGKIEYARTGSDGTAYVKFGTASGSSDILKLMVFLRSPFPMLWYFISI